MRATVEVKDLNSAQVAHLARQVPVNGREFLPGIPRVCTMFELAEGVDLHVEMDVAELATLMIRLATIGLRATAEAALVETAGEPEGNGLPWLPSADLVRNLSATEAAKLTKWGNDPCQHGAPVTVREASVFEGAFPTVTYADGCQSYGPYQGF
jgi:hypothetical protein